MKTLSDKLEWAKTQPWATAMSACPQNPKWHGEGDVWKHTLLCCEALEKLSEYKDLNHIEMNIVEWAMIFHDIGKPETTTIQDGEVITNNHSGKSCHLARQILMQMKTPFHYRERICNLIRWHMFPARIVRVPDSVAHVVFTSCLCENRLLYVIGKADAFGKISENHDSETAVEIWKEECCKFGCFLNPYLFHNSLARYEFYQSKKFQPYYIPYTDDMFEVIILSGLPGTGKTTYADKQYHNLPLIELDMTREEFGVKPGEDEPRVIAATKEKCLELLRKKRPFVFGAVNHIKSRRERWTKMAAGYGAEVTIVYLEKPIEVVLKQNKSRERVVPESVIYDMRDCLEVPNWDECHELVFKCDDN